MEQVARTPTAFPAAVGIFLLAVVVYATTLGNGFVWDDRTILLAHQDLGDWSRAAETLTSNFFQESQERGRFDYWRPLVVVSHMLETSLFGRSAWGFHLVNVLLHATASGLVFGLGLLWFERRRGVALLAGLLFAVHPVHVEAVAWVSGRSDLLLGLLLLSALIADRRSSLTGSVGWQLASLVAFAGALFSKEAAAIFPVLVAARSWLERPPETPLRAGALAAMRAALPSLLLLGLYLWLRFAVVGVEAASGGLLPGERLGLFWTWWSAFWLYTRLLVWPAPLIILHEVELLESPWSWSVLAGLAAFLVLAGGAWRLRRREPGVTFGALVWLVGLLPASHFVVPLSSQGQAGFPFAERFAYAPSIGFCLLAGWLLGAWLPERWRGVGRARAGELATMGMALLVVVAMGAGTWRRCRDWRDEVSLFGATVEQVPDNGTAQLNYAAALGDLAERTGDAARRGDLIERALGHQQRALELSPGNYRVYFGLANLYRLRGDGARAEAQYREALRLNPTLHQAMVNLGVLLAERGEAQGAAMLFEEALRLRPRDARVKVNLAHVLQISGRPQEAVALYEAALELDPSLEAARDGLERAQAAARATRGEGH